VEPSRNKKQNFKNESCTEFHEKPITQQKKRFDELYSLAIIIIPNEAKNEKRFNRKEPSFMEF
jgi:hypothetical protein